MFQQEGCIPVVCGDRGGSAGPHGSHGCDIGHSRVAARAGLHKPDRVFQIERMDIGNVNRKVVFAGDESRASFKARGCCYTCG